MHTLLQIDSIGAEIGTLSQDPLALERAEIQAKYSTYIEREKENALKLQRLEGLGIPDNFDYHQLQGLSMESRQKLSQMRPATIGQAQRISGVSPSDISVLLVHFGR